MAIPTGDSVPGYNGALPRRLVIFGVRLRRLRLVARRTRLLGPTIPSASRTTATLAAISSAATISATVITA